MTAVADERKRVFPTQGQTEHGVKRRLAMAGTANSGRRPLPSAIKQQRGTYRQKQLDEPKPPSGWPECPPHVTGVAATMWNEVCLILDKMGVLTEADGLALAFLVVTCAHCRKA